MFNPLSWLKRTFSSKSAQKVREAAQSAAAFLEEHDEAFADAVKLVEQAEVAFKEPKSGASKWAFVMDALKTVWPELKPHILSFLASVAVGLLKGGK